MLAGAMYLLRLWRSFAFLSFRHSILCICTKGSAWSTKQIRNTKRFNFCEQNLQDTDQSTVDLKSVNFHAGYCLEESRYQTSLNFVRMISVTSGQCSRHPPRNRCSLHLRLLLLQGQNAEKYLWKWNFFIVRCMFDPEPMLETHPNNYCDSPTFIS
jgi:hypothetical protein